MEARGGEGGGRVEAQGSGCLCGPLGDIETCLGREWRRGVAKGGDRVEATGRGCVCGSDLPGAVVEATTAITTL